MIKKNSIGLITTLVALGTTSLITPFTPKVTAANLRKNLSNKQKISTAIIDKKTTANSKSRLNKNFFKPNNKPKLSKNIFSFIRQTNVNTPKSSANFKIAQAVSSGEASWYGPGFNGQTTANGEVFNQNELTAAHPNLPFGTKVKVTNMNNGRSVVVRINDRGPYAAGRVIDLSAAAAQVLGVVSTGVAPVQLQVLGR